MPKPSEKALALKPKVIKTEADYEAAMARVEEIFDAKPGTASGEELELLLLLVEKYEEKVYPIGLPDPITAIRFRMDQQKLKPKDLIPFIGSKSKVSEVLNGQRELSLTMIRKLVKGLGIPAEVLLQEPGAKLPSSELLEFGKQLPLAEMYKRGWFPGFVGSLQELKEQIEDVLAHFAAPVGKKAMVPALNRQMVRSGSVPSQPALIAWRIRVVSEAMREHLPVYRPGTVTPEFLTQLVKLSYLEDGPKLAREFLNKNGIHLIIERHLPKTFLDGAAMRLEDGSRLVAMTLRYDRLDNFWFTLLHELAHVSKHLDGTDVDVIYDDLDNESSEVWEREADSIAREALIPAKHWKQANLGNDHSQERVKSFAKSLRIHPAIPAGRIRYESKNYRLLGDLVGRGCVRKLFETNT
jgi:HTH-type transcriptional regulator / antitoxin HigA